MSGGATSPDGGLQTLGREQPPSRADLTIRYTRRTWRHCPERFQSVGKPSVGNSFTNAKQTLLQLISNTRSKYILLSYNSCGIIPINELDISLQQFGHVRKIPIEHKTYNRLKGMGNYKRKDQKEKNEEFLWLIRKI